ncbi:MAG: hypothetical protein WDN76_08895 [Alphaproteobacteria bacterium]
MYAKDDLRSTMQPASAGGATSYHHSSYGKFYQEKPVETGPEGDTWYHRGQNLVVAYSNARKGGVFTRKNQPDEWAVLLPRAGMEIEITAGGQTVTVKSPALAFMPPGDSTITAKLDGPIWRFVTVRSPDWVNKCPNKDEYNAPDPNIPPLQDWPAPIGGYKIRVYSGETPPTPGRFGRLYRSSNIMFNFGGGRPGPRDIHKMSPHHHNDFEQYSLGINGSYVHHLRWPWTTDMDNWFPDEHELCGTPSVAVIPPPSIHTSQAMDPGDNHLIDVFCPPRRDFSSKPGWVLNVADYPDPADLVQSAAPLKE